jgi:hypothetical protein
MRIGYLFRGFLGDVKWGSDLAEVSTPDGNATYSWSIEHECEKRGYKLIPLGHNLDAPAAGELGEGLFAAFSKQRRVRSYERMLKRGWTQLSNRMFPDLDLVLVEWRWPIPGRNTEADRGHVHFQDDLDRQTEVLKVYSERGTPIVLWDLDHKLTWDDEENLEWEHLTGRVSVIETALKPRSLVFPRHTVQPPTVVNDLLQYDIDDRMPSYHLGYIGSRYERDETIDKWIGPIAPAGTHRVKFWGKWEPAADVRARWPGVTFAGRVGVKEFQQAYSRVAAVPLLAKQSYYECGFITPRPWEAVLFGSIPVGLGEHFGITNYCDKVVNSAEELLEFGTAMRRISSIRRRVLREEAAHKLRHMDVRHFVDVLEKLAGDASVETTESTVRKERDDNDE